MGKLDLQVEADLWEAITVIEARDVLMAMTVADFPHQKKGKRQEIHRNLYKKAFPATFKKSPTASLADLGKILSGVKNGRG